jgi:hypothetical protein
MSTRSTRTMKLLKLSNMELLKLPKWESTKGLTPKDRETATKSKYKRNN